MSLRWKLVLALVLVSACGSAAVGLLSYQSTESRLVTEIDRSLVQATDRFLERPGRAGQRGGSGMGMVLRIPDRPLGIEQYVVQVTDTSGVVLGATTGVTLPVPDAPVSSSVASIRTVTSAEGLEYRVRTIAVDQAVLQVGRDMSEIENVLDDLRTRFLLLGLGVAGASAVAGLFISAGITSRLRKLSMAAEHVATTGRLDVDAPVTGRDEAGRLGRTFRDMLASLARSKEQQQRLVEDAGHELRTPLTSLRTNLDVVKRHPNMSSEMRDQVMADIDRDAAELAALVEEVVAVAADRHGTELPVPTDLRVLVDSVAGRASRRSGREVTVDGGHALAVVRPHIIERAVSNLVDNALKFDTTGGPIEIRLTVDASRATVSTLDRGPGIPVDELDRIFERFHRSVTSRTLPGSGLGLSIVAEAAQSHGGDVHARNRPDGGADVGFSLPLA